MNRKFLLVLAGLLSVLGALLPSYALAQGSIPFTINNTSPFSDNDLYVAIVGLDANSTTDRHVWVNARNSQVLPMDRAYNTVVGPTYSGNTGPGQDSRYANCFTRLSDIPNKTFTLPQIKGCRVFISRGQQLYLYFYGATGAPSGYAAPNPQNPVDPNRGILYEIIELTNNQYGFFGNTTRVDAFRYPMGLELFGQGYQQRTGELKTAAEIVSAFKANVPSEFQSLVNNATGEITFPSKSPAFYDGTNGTTAGPQGNYFGSYLDAIWNKYQNEDLIFNAGDAGVFKGRIAGGRLTVVAQSGGFKGRTGIVVRKPTSQEAFEGKGVLDNRVGDGDVDLVVQSQLTAAINRHVVNTTTPNPGQQDWYDVSRYYQASPANYYARFWHLPGISIDQKSYGFAYDDVADQSASLHSPKPTKVIATFGGYAGQAPPPPPSNGVATFYSDCNYGGTAVALPVGAYSLVTLQGRGIRNDDISSVRVSAGYEVVLYENDLSGGATLTLSADNSCLTGNALNGGNWNDKTSSILVRAASTAPAFSRQLEAEAANVNNGFVVENCAEGGQDMGYTDAGDYLVWNGVTIPAAGSYLIEYRVASGAGGGTISADLNGGSVQLGNTTIPATGGWQTWTTVSKTVTLSAGTVNFGIYAQTAGFNLNWVRITYRGAAAAVTNATQAAPTPAAGALASASAVAKVSTLELYPNPVTDRLHLQAGQDLAGSSFRILDALGRAALSGSAAAGTVDVSGLRAGVYSLVLHTPGQAPLTRRFVK